MTIDFKKIQIDKELEDLLPPLSKEDYNILEHSLLNNGFKEYFGKIKIWFPDGNDNFNEKSVGYIVDGHNRYRICKKHNIELPYYCYEVVYFNSKEEVIKWMYENQLARRNLSEMDKYETVEKYSAFLNEMAKKNQSDGGKGLSNLTRINTRKEKAKMAGTSDGNYYKLDQIKKSGNKEIIEQVRHKKISVDKAYREIKNPKPKEKESITPEQKIIEFDNRMDEIDKEISSLQTERESLMRRRTSLFESLDIPCELKYEFIESVSPIDSRDCRFYIEIDGHKQVFVECGVSFETPFAAYTSQVPEKYKNDFIMLYRKAHFEEEEHFNRTFKEWYKKHGKNNETKLTDDADKDKDFYKRCFRILAKSFHPDNGDGNMEDMQCLNQLKVMWGI